MASPPGPPGDASVRSSIVAALGELLARRVDQAGHPGASPILLEQPRIERVAVSLIHGGVRADVCVCVDEGRAVEPRRSPAGSWLTGTREEAVDAALLPQHGEREQLERPLVAGKLRGQTPQVRQ